MKTWFTGSPTEILNAGRQIEDVVTKNIWLLVAKLKTLFANGQTECFDCYMATRCPEFFGQIKKKNAQKPGIAFRSQEIFKTILRQFFLISWVLLRISTNISVKRL